MQYGHFDDRNKEYVITRPDTPESWSNYMEIPPAESSLPTMPADIVFISQGAWGREELTKLVPLSYSEMGAILLCP